MAENRESFCENVAHYVQAKLGICIEYVGDLPWQERERLFAEGMAE